MINWILERFGLRIEKNEPPVRDVRKAATLGVIASIFESEAAQADAQWQITKRNMKRRPPADSWLHQGGGHGGPSRPSRPNDDWLRR
jgi:hypothetical protein